ncbi:hypothetical protein HK405_003691 [Cladochytrium tenue]|nr:hypothetical protein HK405_003691 [Cladochytrium tenue]
MVALAVEAPHSQRRRQHNLATETPDSVRRMQWRRAATTTRTGPVVPVQAVSAEKAAQNPERRRRPSPASEAVAAARAAASPSPAGSTDGLIGLPEDDDEEWAPSSPVLADEPATPPRGSYSALVAERASRAEAETRRLLGLGDDDGDDLGGAGGDGAADDGARAVGGSSGAIESGLASLRELLHSTLRIEEDDEREFEAAERQRAAAAAAAAEMAAATAAAVASAVGVVSTTTTTHDSTAAATKTPVAAAAQDEQGTVAAAAAVDASTIELRRKGGRARRSLAVALGGTGDVAVGFLVGRDDFRPLPAGAAAAAAAGNPRRAAHVLRQRQQQQQEQQQPRRRQPPPHDERQRTADWEEESARVSETAARRRGGGSGPRAPRVPAEVAELWQRRSMARVSVGVARSRTGGVDSDGFAEHASGVAVIERDVAAPHLPMQAAVVKVVRRSPGSGGRSGRSSGRNRAAAAPTTAVATDTGRQLRRGTWQHSSPALVGIGEVADGRWGDLELKQRRSGLELQGIVGGGTGGGFGLSLGELPAAATAAGGRETAATAHERARQVHQQQQLREVLLSRRTLQSLEEAPVGAVAPVRLPARPLVGGLLYGHRSGLPSPQAPLGRG